MSIKEMKPIWSSGGLISGAGLLFLFFAYLNQSGPGMVCVRNNNGGQRCTQEYGPWPFLLIGLGLFLTGLALLWRTRSDSGPVSEQ